MDKKDKKKTLTISSNLTKKIDSSVFNTSGKKTYSVENKKPFRGTRQHNNSSQPSFSNKNQGLKKNKLC